MYNFYKMPLYFLYSPYYYLEMLYFYLNDPSQPYPMQVPFLSLSWAELCVF